MFKNMHVGVRLTNDLVQEIAAAGPDVNGRSGGAFWLCGESIDVQRSVARGKTGRALDRAVPVGFMRFQE